MKKEVMCLDGTESKDWDHAKYTKEKRVSAFII